MKLYYFVDHTSRYMGNSGVQRVVRGLARALLEIGCDLEFVCWDADKKVLALIDQVMLKNLARFHGPVLDTKKNDGYTNRNQEIKPFHESQSALNGPDWLLVPEVTCLTFHAEPPTQGIIDYCSSRCLKTAFVFYDAIPLKLSEYSAAEPRHTEYMQQLALADLTIPISRFAADDLVSFYLNRLYFQVETLPVISPLLLPSEMYDQERRLPNADHNSNTKLIISVGTIEPRKNQLGLLHAFQRFCEENPRLDVRLVLIGSLHPAVAADVLQAIKNNPRVRYLEQLDDNALARFYSECDFTVFPSVEEGYGLPIVESLWNGKPCVCANFGSMAEIAAGGGCLQVDTRSVDEIYAAISKLLLEPETTLDMLENEIRERKFVRWLDYGSSVKQLLENQDAPSATIKKIYYWVDHACTYPPLADASQQRIHNLAAAWQAGGILITPVKWDSGHGMMVVPEEAELTNLEKWQGPAADSWDMTLPGEDELGAWLVVPEPLTYQGAPNMNEIAAYSRACNLRTAIIFSSTDLDGSQGEPRSSCSCGEYMSLLPLFDLVISDSEQSKLSLWNFLRRNLARLVNVEHRLRAVLLPTGISGEGHLPVYAEYVKSAMRELAKEAGEWHVRTYPPENVISSRSAFHAPILSICISTYSRASWLALSLPLLLKQTAPFRDVLEVIVCDNASIDDTPRVVEPYLDEAGFFYFRNRENVGVAGNLKVAAQHVHGQYVWMLDEADMLQHGTVEKVMKAILEHPDVSLVYLNYNHTNIEDAEKVGDVERFLSSAVPACLPGPDIFAPVSRLTALSGNFFTRIDCLVFRYDHALRAYSQNTSGRPFSSLLTCNPTSYYVCQHMMNEMSCWIGDSGPVVNMNVSVGKYASLWLLERLPELYDLAELKGANSEEVDCWRSQNLSRTLPYLEQIYFADIENNIQYFSIERFFARHKHLQEFRNDLRSFLAVYEKAYKNGHSAARLEPKKLLEQFGLSQEQSLH